MNKNDDQITSRRVFNKSLVTAAVVTPILSAMMGCKTREPQPVTPGPSPAASPTGPSIVSCPQHVTEEHIPPMGLDGSGSLRIEVSNKLVTTDRTSPFSYVETEIQTPNDRYGELESVLVISEFFPKVDNEYISIKNYVGLPTGSQLLLWYQRIFPPDPPGSDMNDVNYEEVADYPANDPDVRIIGGPGNGRYFRLVIKHRQLPPQPDLTHKPGRQWRYIHQGDRNTPGLGRHFRIGQWRIVGSDGITVVAPNFEHRGALDYKIYPTFEDFHGS